MKLNFYTTLLAVLFIGLTSLNAQTPVPDIATLRGSAQGADYTLSNEVVLTYQQDFRGQKYIQDGTAAILIDDNGGTITSVYDLMDGITGLTGTLGEFGGMMQFVPTIDPGAASSTANMMAPQSITLMDLTNNFEDYESELVEITDASFADMGMVFEVGTAYAITDASGTYNFRTTFYSADYIGTTVPEMASMIGLPNSRNDGDYFSPRSSADINSGVIINPGDVSSIADLRDSTIGSVYTLTSEAILTYQQDFRGQKYIQDGTAGILIDDNGGTITSVYNLMDGITGLTGTLGEFGGMMQFVPMMDPGTASSTGNMITPEVVTLADLKNNFEEYESELVMISDVAFEDVDSTFEVGTAYAMHTGTDSFNFRTTFYSADYIGGIIPDSANVVGLPNSRNDGDYFTARSMTDIDTGNVVVNPGDVATIAELRAGTMGETYTLTGEAMLTYQQDFRGQKYIQDATAGILIDDNDGMITSTYAINDGITGISGTLGEFGGMMQFVPNADPGAASSTGNTVTPQVITTAELTNDFEAYESELVTIVDATFTDEGGLFNTGTAYEITDASGTYNFRTTFFSSDYIGGTINQIGNITGLPNSRTDGEYITARDLNDLTGDITVSVATEVATRAELRAGTIGSLYRLTGEAVLTYQQDFRGQRYIQDATAGILIDDNGGTITTTYNRYDGITGLTGTLSEFGGMLQFVPAEDPGAASSSANVVTPNMVTMTELTNDFEAYESELTTIVEANFADVGQIFENGTVYGMTDAGGAYNMRTTFFDVDYIGGIVPDGAILTGLPNSRNDGDYFTPRDAGDFELLGDATNDIELTNVSIYPNPSNGNFVIDGRDLNADYQVSILDLTGRVIMTQSISFTSQQIASISLDDNLQGAYILKMTNIKNGATRGISIFVK